MVKILSICRTFGITLNKSKFAFAKSELPFAGYVVGDRGVSADPAKIKAISHFPTPASLTDLCSFMGLVGQLGSFSSRVADLAGPLHYLLKKENIFVWDDVHTAAVNGIKKEL